MSCAGIFGNDCGCGCSGELAVGAISSEVAFEFLKKVDTQVESLDRDVTNQTRPDSAPNMIGQGFISPWNEYVNEDPADDEFPIGWRAFRRDASSFIDRFFDTDDIIRRTGEFEHAFLDFRRQFVALGGVPTLPEQTPGAPFLPTDKPPEDKVESLVTAGIVIAGIFTAGYVLHGLAATGAFKK